jgi:hypothetical protein
MKWQQLVLSIGVIAAMTACERTNPEPATASAARETAPPPATVVEHSTAVDETQGESSAITAVLEDYYRAISARDFKRAYSAWGEGGPPGQDYATFVKGFERTASVEVKTGTPSRIEAAAGSRYVTVPVTITATTTDGKRQRFEGTYTVRRSVVDGASEAQRKWHLYRGAIRTAPARP